MTVRELIQELLQKCHSLDDQVEISHPDTESTNGFYHYLQGPCEIVRLGANDVKGRFGEVVDGHRIVIS